jgi:hypothetical protein
MGRGARRVASGRVRPPFEIRAQDDLDHFVIRSTETDLGTALVLQHPTRQTNLMRGRRRSARKTHPAVRARFRAAGETPEFLFIEATNEGDGVGLRMAFGTEMEVSNSPYSFEMTGLVCVDKRAEVFQRSTARADEVVGPDRASAGDVDDKAEHDDSAEELELQRVAGLEEALTHLRDGENAVEVQLDAPGDDLLARAQDYHASQRALAEEPRLPRRCAQIRSLGRTWQPGAVLIWRSFRLELREMISGDGEVDGDSSSTGLSSRADVEPFGSAFELLVSRTDSLVKAANKR